MACPHPGWVEATSSSQGECLPQPWCQEGTLSSMLGSACLERCRSPSLEAGRAGAGVGAGDIRIPACATAQLGPRQCSAWLHRWSHSGRARSAGGCCLWLSLRLSKSAFNHPLNPAPAPTALRAANATRALTAMIAAATAACLQSHGDQHRSAGRAPPPRAASVGVSVPPFPRNKRKELQ